MFRLKQWRRGPAGGAAAAFLTQHFIDLTLRKTFSVWPHSRRHHKSHIRFKCLSVWGFCHITKTLEGFLLPCWWKKLQCLGTNATPRYSITTQSLPPVLGGGGVFVCWVVLCKAGPSSSPGEEGGVWSLSGGLHSRRHSPPCCNCCAEGGGRARGERRQEGTRGVTQCGFLGSGGPCYARWSVWVSQLELQGIDNRFIS